MRLHVDASGSGRDLVLLHGWGFDSRVWRGILPGLAERHRVHAVDLPGHGGSRALPARGFDEAVGMLEEALPGEAIVCGWSLGAQLAIALARHAPRRVRALVLASATPCFVARAGWDCAMDPAAFDAFADGLARDPGAALARFIRLAAVNGSNAREAIRVLSESQAGAPADPAALTTTLGWLRDNDLRAQAGQVQVPAIAIHGEADAVAPCAAGRWLAEQIPRASFVGVPGCAHVPFLTHPCEFAAAIEACDG